MENSNKHLIGFEHPSGVKVWFANDTYMFESLRDTLFDWLDKLPAWTIEEMEHIFAQPDEYLLNVMWKRNRYVRLDFSDFPEFETQEDFYRFGLKFTDKAQIWLTRSENHKIFDNFKNPPRFYVRQADKKIWLNVASGETQQQEQARKKFQKYGI